MKKTSMTTCAVTFHYCHLVSYRLLVKPYLLALSKNAFILFRLSSLQEMNSMTTANFDRDYLLV